MGPVSFPKSLVVPFTNDGTGRPSASGHAKPRRGGRVLKVKRPKPRESMVPGSCTLKVTDTRIREIEIELRLLRLDDYPNAIAVLFRVFLELSVDAYLDNNGIPYDPDKTTLRVKLQMVSDDLVKRTKLTHAQAAPVRKAMQKDAFLVPSIDLMHAYIHNKHVFPGASDLRVGWDNLQPFIQAMWSP